MPEVKKENIIMRISNARKQGKERECKSTLCFKYSTGTLTSNQIKTKIKYNPAELKLEKAVLNCTKSNKIDVKHAWFPLFRDDKISLLHSITTLLQFLLSTGEQFAGLIQAFLNILPMSLQVYSSILSIHRNIDN